MSSLRFRLLLAMAALAFLLPSARAGVVISEIMYHPVEEPAFLASGRPALDLTNDVHEFIEIYNDGIHPVELEGWRLSGGIDYLFPTGAVIQPGQYRVVAKDPARLALIPQYSLALSNLFGGYT